MPLRWCANQECDKAVLPRHRFCSKECHQAHRKFQLICDYPHLEAEIRDKEEVSLEPDGTAIVRKIQREIIGKHNGLTYIRENVTSHSYPVRRRKAIISGKCQKKKIARETDTRKIFTSLNSK